MLLGAFLIYCGQSAMNKTPAKPDGGFVKGAMGQQGSTCCTPPAQTFTKLWEGDVTPMAPSPAIAVGAYRELVLYYIDNGYSSTFLVAKFRPDSSTDFLMTSALFAGTKSNVSAGRLQVNGSDVQFSTGAQIHIVVAGVQ
jgi:hypothetical protein